MKSRAIQISSAVDEIKAGFYNRNAFKDKGKLLLVLKTGIAGMQFHVDEESEEGRSIVNKLKPGEELRLFREADNDYDKWAIAVYTKDDEQIGYVTRFKNETIARLMDAGKRFIAYIDDLDDVEHAKSDASRAGTENYGLPFSVYMDEG